MHVYIHLYSSSFIVFALYISAYKSQMCNNNHYFYLFWLLYIYIYHNDDLCINH